MAFKTRHGTVGIIKPTMRPGGLEDMIRILPPGIGVIPLYNDIRRGTDDEFEAVMAEYDDKVARLAGAGVDLIHPEGAPPFMRLGYDGERARIEGWEQQHSIPVFTSGTNHIAALRALGVTKFVGASYFAGEINDTFARYFTDAGFETLAMEGIAVPFQEAGNLSSDQVYTHVKQVFLANPGAEAVYMLGSAWSVLDTIDVLERDLGVPVVHPIPARVWEIQKRLRVNEPQTGLGRLLADMPEMV